MTASDAAPPPGVLTPADVYKGGRLAAHMWRVGDTVSFRYREDYVGVGGTAVAFTLPTSAPGWDVDRMRLPAFFAGLLPEGESRRRHLQRALHLAEDDELGLLAAIGADTIGDVQVVPHGQSLPPDVIPAESGSWEDVSFTELWREIPAPADRSAIPGVQPKLSAHSRSLTGGATGPVILKFAVEGWDGALENERFFMRQASRVGLDAPVVNIVSDRDGNRALEVARFDRTVVGGSFRRHAQEDGTQVLGRRPGEKYDLDAREVVAGLASRCAAPKVAVRDLFHQLAYSYAIGNNDVHAKNLSIRQDPDSGLWMVSPIYDVLHTWPYESDHRFHPAIRPDGPHGAVTSKHWLALAEDLGLPLKAARRIIETVVRGVQEVLPRTGKAIGPGSPDLRRRIDQRMRYLQA